MHTTFFWEKVTPESLGVMTGLSKTARALRRVTVRYRKRWLIFGAAIETKRIADHFVRLADINGDPTWFHRESGKSLTEGRVVVGVCANDLLLVENQIGMGYQPPVPPPPVDSPSTF